MLTVTGRVLGYMTAAIGVFAAMVILASHMVFAAPQCWTISREVEHRSTNENASCLRQFMEELPANVRLSGACRSPIGLHCYGEQT
jgi:porphobilinogen deaminase